MPNAPNDPAHSSPAVDSLPRSGEIEKCFHAITRIAEGRDSVIGINFDSDDSPAVFDRAVTELTQVARDADVELVSDDDCRRGF
jgi:hypothetical protein